MDEIKAFENYEQYKQELDFELKKSAEGFVKIGFLLRVARDTNILDGKYENVNEFAKAEYNIDKSTVSRWIQINEEFSKGGCSDCLEEQYQGYGWAKLTLLLQIPKEIRDELSPEYSKAEIQMVKTEIDEEKKVSDLEVMMEHEPDEVAAVDDLLAKAIIALGKQEPELYLSIHKTASWSKRIDTELLKDDMTPNNEAMYSIRIPGTGRVMLSLKADGKNTLTNIRSGEKAEYTWEAIAVAWTIVIDLEKAPIKNWKEQYGETWPIEEKKEVAPVQQKKPEPKKQSKVTPAKKPEVKKEEKPINTRYETDSSQNMAAVEPKTEENGFKETNSAENEPVTTTDEQKEADIVQFPEKDKEFKKEKSENSATNNDCNNDCNEEMQSNMVAQEPEHVQGEIVEDINPPEESIWKQKNTIVEISRQNRQNMISAEINDDITRLKEQIEKKAWVGAKLAAVDLQLQLDQMIAVCTEGEDEE